MKRNKATNALVPTMGHFFQEKKVNKKGETGSGGAHANLGTFIDEIKTNVANDVWRLPNVISHDFVTEQTCSQIIALNPLYVA